MTKPASAIAEIRRMVSGASYRSIAENEEEVIKDDADETTASLLRGSMNLESSKIQASVNTGRKPKLTLGNKARVSLM
jgi:hypothetical protein